MSDWDAANYHKLSDPQRKWGLRVLDRLAPLDGETILDIGCGTGRLTAAIAKRAPRARLVAADRSGAMLQEARSHFPAAAMFVQADGAALPLRADTFDAVFSTATFHWISDHGALFSEIHRVLRHGGRLVAQCGGGSNLRMLYDRAHALRSSDRYATFFEGWSDPWNFASPEEAASRLATFGFHDIDVRLEPTPTRFPDMESYEKFVATVCLRHHLARLPADLGRAFVHELAVAAASDDPPFTLDYWRLNLDARRA